MDQAAVKLLLIKYLDCVKLLLNDALPDDLPEVLDDVIQQTMEFSDEMKSHQVRGRQIRNSITEDIRPITPQFIDNKSVVPEAVTVRRRLTMYNEIDAKDTVVDCKDPKWQPRVMIQPLRINNRNVSEGDGFKVVKTDKQAVASIERLRNDNKKDSEGDGFKVRNQPVVRVRRLNENDLKYNGVELEVEMNKMRPVVLDRRSIMESENYSKENNVKPKRTTRQLKRLRADKDVEVKAEDRQNRNPQNYQHRNRRRCTVNRVNRY